MKKIKWLCHQVRWFFIRCIHALTGKYLLDADDYGGHILHSAREGNDKLCQLLKAGQPFAFCRYSFVEMDLMIKCRTEDFFNIATYKRNCQFAENLIVENDMEAGVRKFYEIMLNATRQATILGVWKSLPMGDGFIQSIEGLTDTFFTAATAVEPYGFRENPWSKQLAGKRVLAVSPFPEEIAAQYKKREFIWGDKEILPEFELLTMESVWFFPGCQDERFTNWFEAYDFLYDKIMSYEFDVCLLGCGPFGFPLAAKIKESGRCAVHMGGAIQLLFGIKGNRWDHTDISKLYNEYWIRPGENTKPQGAEKLDNSCYW